MNLNIDGSYINVGKKTMEIDNASNLLMFI